MLPVRRAVAALLAVSSLAAQASKPSKASAAAEPAPTAEMQSFAAWLAQYEHGAVRLVKDGKTDEAAVADIDTKMAAVAKTNTLAAAKILFEAASFEPKPANATSSAQAIDFYRELQPWRVQSIAAKHLRSMTGDGVLPWLLQMLASTNLRTAKKTTDQGNAMAVLRVLAGHPSLEAQLELMKAARSMPPELRVQAVNSMAKGATLDLLPTFFEMLGDGEPNVRIAAANAIGATLQPHVDETAGKQPTGDVLALRDQAMAKLEALLVRDPIWQVRNAAATAMAIQKCKAAVPPLIRGNELRREPNLAYGVLRDRAAERGYKIAPIMYGRAKAVLGLVPVKPRGSKRAEKEAAATAPRSLKQVESVAAVRFGKQLESVRSLEQLVGVVKDLDAERRRLRAALERIVDLIEDALEPNG